MNILQFIQTFPNEETCLKHFASVRLERGVKCEKCDCQTKTLLVARPKAVQVQQM